MKPVYLDYAATTPVDPAVIEVMVGCLGQDGLFANPASRSHLYGWQAEDAVETARRQVADLIHADPREIVWTSGATEANNLALKGAAQARSKFGRHIVSVATEHKAVLDTLTWLSRQGFEVTLLAPSADGRLDAATLRDALREDTILVSCMHANNETGVIHDIAALGQVCRDVSADRPRGEGILVHVDAAQTLGKLPIDLSQLPVDLMSFSAHKLYGPKGVGVLYVRRAPGVVLEAQIHGGGHERGMRSGTLATHQLAGFGAACALAATSMDSDNARIQTLRDRLWAGLQAIGGVHLNGHPDGRLPGHLNVAFEGLDGELLLTALSDIAVSTGSACTSASLEPSYVLRAMGISDALAHASLRFSVGRYTSSADIERALSHIADTLARLRGE